MPHPTQTLPDVMAVLTGAIKVGASIIGVVGGTRFEL
jgi:hypothetical protein